MSDHYKFGFTDDKHDDPIWKRPRGFFMIPADQMERLGAEYSFKVRPRWMPARLWRCVYRWFPARREMGLLYQDTDEHLAVIGKVTSDGVMLIGGVKKDGEG